MKKSIITIGMFLTVFGILYSAKNIGENLYVNYEKSKLEKNLEIKNNEKIENEKKLSQLTEKENDLKEKFNKIREEKGIKVVYLTFDDGPTRNNTPQILDILKKNGIKATFFVIGINHDLYKRIVDEGHEIALHTYTHDYKEVYSSEEAFFNDLYRLRDKIKEITGKDPKVTRFPGGSSTGKASKALKMKIINRLTKEGYVYQDWNCDSTDASGNGVPAAVLIQKSICVPREVNLLMHDSQAKRTTVEALQGIIDKYKERGYIFDVLTVDSPKFQHIKQR